MSYRNSIFVFLFTICLWTLLSGCPDTTSITPPVASFTVSATSGDAPFSVTFRDTSTAGSSALVSWEWDFGDGGTSESSDFRYTYQEAGTYTVSLRVVSADGEDTEVQSGLITVTGPCNVSSIALTQPQDGTQIVIGGDLTASPMVFSSEMDCSSDTDSVAYSLNGEEVGTSDTAPYTVVGGDYAQLAPGNHTVTAIATGMLNPGTTVAETATFTVSEAQSGDDTLGNGLPNNPFAVLSTDGDLWLASVSAGPESNTRNVGALRWEGSAEESDAFLSLVLQAGDDLDSSVQVSVARDLLQAGETGVLVVAVASDVATLLGDDEAAMLAAAPGTALSGVPVVEISVLVSNDAGTNFDEIDNSRIFTDPIILEITGTGASALAGNSLYEHPTFVSGDGTNGIQI